MKPFVVVSYSKRVQAIRYGEPTRGTMQNGVAYAQSQSDTDPRHVNVFDDKHQLWFFDTLDDADNFAKTMSNNTSLCSFGIGKISEVWASKPSESSKSKFTDKGLLPA